MSAREAQLKREFLTAINTILSGKEHADQVFPEAVRMQFGARIQEYMEHVIARVRRNVQGEFDLIQQEHKLSVALAQRSLAAHFAQYQKTMAGHGLSAESARDQLRAKTSQVQHEQRARLLQEIQLLEKENEAMLSKLKAQRARVNALTQHVVNNTPPIERALSACQSFQADDS